MKFKCFDDESFALMVPNTDKYAKRANTLTINAGHQNNPISAGIINDNTKAKGTKCRIDNE